MSTIPLLFAGFLAASPGQMARVDPFGIDNDTSRLRIINSPDWGSPVSDDEGIKIFVRIVEGNDIKAYRGVTQIPGHLSAAVALFKDVDNYVNWVNECQVAKKISGDEMSHLIYMVTGTPLLVDERDMFIRFKLSQPREHELHIQFDHVDNLARPPGQDTVRVNSLHGEWIVRSNGRGQLHIDYSVFIDPGGSIPAWLVNMRARSDPFETLKAVRTQMQLDKYKSARFDFINE